jgi:hypothetical protein
MANYVHGIVQRRRTPMADECFDEFSELEDWCNGDVTEAAHMLADIREWRAANPGWETWTIDERCSRFLRWLQTGGN